VLDSVLGRLARQQDANVLVGFDTADDAGVYQLTPELALVQTIDFFTPIVDDPYTFGQIAAVNSLSDVYAMGGRPISSLAMVCFPDKADVDILERILAGGLSKMMEAGCTVIGGHSVRDPETKFGYSVTGTIDPRRIFANSAAQAGDALVFTKGLGTGVIGTAIKRQQAESAWIDAATLSMTTLNKVASEIAQRFNVHGMTDVTGFGLIGHSREMALGSKVGIRITAANVPLIDGAMTCVDRGFVPGGLTANRDFAECLVTYADTVPANLRTLLYDPQTAGGLLISLPADEAPQLVTELHAAGISEASQIGEVMAAEKPSIEVL
jgi:selenide,water dikinase